MGEVFEKGFSESEFKSIESEFNFTFPPDLKEFLSIAQPISKSWINWRNTNNKKFNESLFWPYKGMCFDIEHNDFWLNDWGKKPESLKECFDIAEKAIEKAPKLIPIYGHRYIPDRPNKNGNPVFSVYQTDIICYGKDLEMYLDNEFFNDEFIISKADEIKKIDFWSNLLP